MTSDQDIQQPESQPGEYRAGERSITGIRGPSRFEMVRNQKRRSVKSRPFLIAAGVLLLGLLAIPAYGFYDKYVAPPRKLAVQVGDERYTRGDVVNFVRFNQRLAEDAGIPFELGTSLFDALQTIQDNELAFQVAPRLGITVDPEEVDERVEFILGFESDAVAEARSDEFLNNVAESKRQFLNRVGLPEDVYKDFIKKSMFKERVRNFVSDSVPRIQPVVHLYEIILQSNDQQTVARMERSLASGTPIEAVVQEFSIDGDVRRDLGDRGWIPARVRRDLDFLLYGTNQQGNRLLPIGEASAPQFDAQTNLYSVYVVDEYAEAREVDDVTFEVLVDNAMNAFLNEERRKIYLYMDLDSEIYDWVNAQVKQASNVPTPDPNAQPTRIPGADLLPPGVTFTGAPEDFSPVGSGQGLQLPIGPR